MDPIQIDYSIYNWFVDISHKTGDYGKVFKIASIIFDPEDDDSDRLIKTSNGYHELNQAKLFEGLDEAICYSKRLKKTKVLK